MQINEQVANYLLWLEDRGINLPVYIEQTESATAPKSVTVSTKLLFIGDQALNDPEHQLLQNIAKALKLAQGDFHYSTINERSVLLQNIAELKPVAVVILGGQALNLVSGKNLDFSPYRGKVWTPELYGIPTVVTYHLRDMLKNPDNKSLVWADLNKLKDSFEQAGNSL